MKILVTGHNGYIGQVMVPLLQSAGHEVTGLDTMFFEDCQFDAAPKVAEIHKDIRDVVPADLEGFDAVLFLAALSNDALGDLNPDLTFAINSAATVECAKAAKAAGVSRFVFSSSGGRHLFADVHAQRDGLWPLAEPAHRPGRQQPDGLCADDRRGADEVRRHALAPVGPHRGHQPRVPGRGRSRPRRDPRPGVQRGDHRRELSHPRGGPDGRRSRAARARTCATTASTSTRSRRRCPRSSRPGRCARASSRCTTPTSRTV